MLPEIVPGRKMRLVTRSTRIQTIPFVTNFVAFTGIAEPSNARFVFPEMNRTHTRGHFGKCPRVLFFIKHRNKPRTEWAINCPPANKKQYIQFSSTLDGAGSFILKLVAADVALKCTGSLSTFLAEL